MKKKTDMNKQPSIKESILRNARDRLAKLSKEKLVKLAEESMSKLSEENLVKISEEKILKISEDNKTALNRIENALYRRPFIKVPVFIGLMVALRLILLIIFKSESAIYYHLSVVIVLIIGIYLIFFLVHLLRQSFKSMLTAKSLWGLFLSYILFIFCLLLLLSSAYGEIERMEKGYLTYGRCSDDFEKDMIKNDGLKSTNYFYYTAVTFFTVGYGDICPMGMAKQISLLNAFIGNFVSVVVMVIAITAYTKRQGQD